MSNTNWFGSKSFFCIPSAIFDFGLSQNELCVYIAYAKYANPNTGECFPSQLTIATNLGWTYTDAEGNTSPDNSRVCRALKLLKDKGLIKVRRRKNLSAVLTLVSPSPSPVYESAASTPSASLSEAPTASKAFDFDEFDDAPADLTGKSSTWQDWRDADFENSIP